ncbi:MAG: hypothetical protein RLY35_873 [Bacteroidota bacterium]|jgi:hypothetical protein
MLRKFSILIFLALSILSTNAQKDVKKFIALSGKITSAVWPDTLGKGLNKAVVEIFAEGKKIASDTASSSGVYKLKKIPYAPSIQIVFKEINHLPKMIDVDFTEFGNDNSASLILEMDAFLYRNEDYYGVNFLKTKPFGKGKYSMKQKGVLWDDRYYFEMKGRLDAVLKAYSE